jgi:hypothetical protein
MAFRLKSRAGVDDQYIHIQGSASTQYTPGNLLKMVNGLPVVIAGQTEQPFMLFEKMRLQPYNGQSMGHVNGSNASPLRPGTEDLTTTAGQRLIGIPLNSSLMIETDVVPLLGGASGGVAAAANTNKAQAICAYGGSTGDLTGGIVYLPDQDWQGVITASGVAAGDVTIVFTPPAPRACTTGDTVQAIPFGVGDKVKWDGSTPESKLSNAVADVSGGLFLVCQVDMQYGNPKGSLALVVGRITDPI